MKDKIYKSWWQQYVVVVSIMLSIWSFVNIGDSSILKFIEESWFVYVPFVFGGILYTYFSYILLTSDKKIKNVDFGYHRRTFLIENINEIHKDPLYAGFGWGFGYQITIYFKKENGDIDYTHINLNHYKRETISDFLNDLHEIKPDLKIDSQVKKLM